VHLVRDEGVAGSNPATPTSQALDGLLFLNYLQTLRVYRRAAYTSAYTNAGCEWRLSGRIAVATTSHGESCPQDGYGGNVMKPSSSGPRAPIDAKPSGSSANGPQRLTATSLPFERGATAPDYLSHQHKRAGLLVNGTRGGQRATPEPTKIR
jgi:hypothetical protein